MLRDVVVVGASLAGLRAAETLRADGYDGRLTMVGAEAHLPYDRPPLSKKVLAGEWEPDRIHLRKPDVVRRAASSTSASGVRAVGARCRHDAAGPLDDGTVLPLRRRDPRRRRRRRRRLPGQPDLPGLFELRTLDDSLALRAAFDERPGRGWS